MLTTEPDHRLLVTGICWLSSRPGKSINPL